MVFFFRNSCCNKVPEEQLVLFSQKNKTQSQGISPAVKHVPFREGTLWKRSFWEQLGGGLEVAGILCVLFLTIKSSMLLLGQFPYYFAGLGIKGCLENFLPVSLCICYSGWQKAQSACIYILTLKHVVCCYMPF